MVYRPLQKHVIIIRQLSGPGALFFVVVACSYILYSQFYSIPSSASESHAGGFQILDPTHTFHYTCLINICILL